MSAQAPARRTYGNWFAVRSAGVLGLSLVGSAIGLTWVLVELMTLVTVGWKPAAIVAVFFAVLFVAVGVPIGKSIGIRVQTFRARMKRENQWRSGMFSRNKKPQLRLPGMLGKVEQLVKTDPYGQPFVVNYNPARGGLYTIIARCDADGPWMQDQEQIDTWVAEWSGVVTAVGQESGVVCAKAITDTAPDTGGKLAASVRSKRAKNAPALATQVMDQCVDDFPSTSADNITYVEVTYKGRALHRKGDQKVILSELARRVPGLMQRCAAAGGSDVTMLDAQAQARAVRVAYDPAMQSTLDRDDLSSDPVEIAWHDAGPVADYAYWDRYLHDSGESVSFEAVSLPPSAIRELKFAGVLAAHTDFLRKRVAIIHRPMDATQSAKTSETDLNTATFLAKQSKKRVTARAQAWVKSADQAREEVAAGAVLDNLSIAMTVTVPSTGGDLTQAVSTMESTAGAVPLRLRRSYGSQAAAFATTLPVGFVPWEHTVISDNVRRFI